MPSSLEVLIWWWPCSVVVCRWLFNHHILQQCAHLVARWVIIVMDLDVSQRFLLTDSSLYW